MGLTPQYYSEERLPAVIGSREALLLKGTKAFVPQSTQGSRDSVLFCMAL